MKAKADSVNMLDASQRENKEKICLYTNSIFYLVSGFRKGC